MHIQRRSAYQSELMRRISDLETELAELRR